MANKTVYQLETEYAQITEQNRKAYDKLHGTGQGIFSWQREYENLIAKTNPTTSEKARIAELKPKFDEAQAAYKKTQEAKNAKKAELDAAKKAESAAKEGSAKLKSAQSAYDKALSAFKVADAELSGYQGDQSYINAFNVLKEAAGALTKAGGKPDALPTPKVTIPPPKTTGGDTSGGDTGGAQDMNLKQTMDFLTLPANKDILSQYQKALAKNFGYTGKTDGSPDVSFVKALTNAFAVRSTLPQAWQSATAKDFIFNPPITIKSSGSATGAGGTKTSSYTVEFDKTKAESLINQVFQSELTRDMTTEEFNVLYSLLDKKVKGNPTKYTVTTDAAGNVKDSKQTGGIDAAQFITDLIKSGAVSGGKQLLPSLKDEYAAIKTQAPELTKLAANKRIYDAAMEKAAKSGEFGAAQKVKETTAYGRGLKELETQIADYAMNAGATNSPDEIASFAQGLYDKGHDLSSEVGMSQLQSWLKYGPSATGQYTGKAGTIVADLASTAIANGLDLNKNFGTKIQDWISQINHGEPINNIKQQIREVAKIGMPDNVKKLIDNGMDLESIYAPYKSTMANVLELSPDAIDMSDPTLRAAITGQGEVPLYDFERALRKDNRWQYTNQAHSEVSGAVQKVLQDFGFMG